MKNGDIMKKSKRKTKTDLSKDKTSATKNKNLKSGKPTNKDLIKSPEKKEETEPGSFTIDMPDVKDIPGQEHIHVPHLRGLNDITISSDDEEGKGIWDEEEED